MERGLILQFLNKPVKIKTNSDFWYRGIVKEVGNDSLVLNDVKVGLTCISFSSIESLESWRPDKNVR